MLNQSKVEMRIDEEQFTAAFKKIHNAILAAYVPTSTTTSATITSRVPVLPSTSALESSTSSLLQLLPKTGLGLQSVSDLLINDILPSLNQGSLSSHYYGFVHGGVTPAALLADFLVSTLDQNVHVHLPKETLATVIEDCALKLLLQLFRFNTEEWKGRTFTTGATGSNILGMVCGREYLLKQKLLLAGYSEAEASVGQMGVLEACVQGRVMGFQVLVAMAHSSNTKAASIVGLGRASVIEIGKAEKPWEIDLQVLEEKLREGEKRGLLSIVVMGHGEVNTGRFDSGIKRARELVDKHGGWIHVDAAMGVFARVFGEKDSREMQNVASWVDGLELADSVTGDGHKLLNVPYDCGFFFTRDPDLLQSTFLNAAAYLATPTSSTTQTSPFNINIENSRRFRALPVYTTLAAYGLDGYKDLVSRLVLHCRAIARVVQKHPAYELLPSEEGSEEEKIDNVFMIVLFRAKDEGLNKILKEKINATGKMYVSGTMWEGRLAVRLAASNWRVRVEKEGPEGWGVVEEVLEGVAG